MWVLLTVCAYAAQPGADKAKAELSELRGKIEALQKSITQSESSRGEAVDALRDSERAISEANRELAGLDQSLKAAHRRSEEIRVESQKAAAQLDARQKSFARMLHSLYVRGGAAQPEVLRVLLSGENPNEMARNLQYAAYVSRASAEAVRGVRESLDALKRLAEEAAARAQELTTLGAEQLNQRKRLEAERENRARVAAKLTAQIQRAQVEIGVMQRNESRLTNLIEQLARIVPRPARETPPREPVQARARNERLPGPAASGTPFSALRGRLALPVRGELASRFGSPRNDGGLVWRGLFLTAPGGTPVKAVAAGRVVYADWLRGFGNLLIVDHGEDYLSLYGYNEALLKQVGDSVGGGETLATVGNSGGSTQSGLYFEIRHQGKPIDPMTWAGR